MEQQFKNKAIAALELELFTHRFSAIAWQMGEALRRTAKSVNVKERMDFSCALLDPSGRLVVNAPHIPVHLGALGLCVRTAQSRIPMSPGDVVVTNHPAFGGSHLPDVTVITPVYGGDPEDSRLPLGFVASRAHHAEIGGMRPGSMPPDATRLVEEGVVLEPQYLVRAGIARWDEIRHRLLSAAYPTRSADENIADLEAAVAANHRGAVALAKLAREHGRESLLHYMSALSEQSAERLKDVLRDYRDQELEALQYLDDGSPLQVRIRLDSRGGIFDFAGSAATHPGNLNATPAVVRSAVLYVLRLLSKGDLPLNEGLLRDFKIEIPEGILNPVFSPDPAKAPAVVGGNVETSQRLVDCLLKAFDVVACSQGTMNNLVFGNQDFGYYETICGGTGAGPSFSGASAVHSHMTNTAITDPEVLEHRYPVRLTRFAIRKGSGGQGIHRGGDGSIRELLFLEPVELSLLCQHRVELPYGGGGGEAGLPGRQSITRRSGELEELDGIDGMNLEAGDRITIETPGGGGWGPSEGRSR
jgi:5-oxoprolinase (ATP-hydrolysing)